MKAKINSIISGTGSYVPNSRIKNKDFLQNEFYVESGELLDKTNDEIISKFKEITTIYERRYANHDLVTSDMAFLASVKAIASCGIDKETLDYIIVAHNFGDVKYTNRKSDMVPSLAARVKKQLEIKNPSCVAYDIIFGCPGWLQALIQADYFIKSGDAKRILVIGAEMLSRVVDPHDRDSMLYSDGAGAVILEAQISELSEGILAHQTRSDAFDYSSMLLMDVSYKVDAIDKNQLYLKMKGRKLYQYALETVPQALKDCLVKSGVHLRQIKKVLIHQANAKMDDAILQRLFDLYEIKDIPTGIMPMTIAEFGNSSVATLPTLLDLILRNEMKDQQINKDDIILFASVGAGMNVNCMVYKM